MSHLAVIVGCGYTGIRFAGEARERDWEVVGTTASGDRLGKLEEMGGEGLRWDVTQPPPERVEEALRASDVAVYSVPSLFDVYESPGDGTTRHVAPVVRTAEAFGSSGRFIYLSSTSVYGDHDGARVDEETPPSPTSPNGKMRRDIEEYVLESAPPKAAHVARLVGIYGPGRTMVDFLKSGRYRLVDGGTKATNRIHVDDIVQTLWRMVEAAPEASRLYNVSDGSPARVVDVVDWLADRLDLERPPEISLEEYRAERGPDAAARWANTYRVSNDRMLDELGVELQYPDVYAGYSEILGIEPPSEDRRRS